MPSKSVDIARAMHESFNRRDLDKVTEQLAEDGVYRDRARQVEFKGRKQFREFLNGWVKAMSDIRVDGANYADAGDLVVATFIGRGVNDGPFGDLPKTGKRVSLPYCELIRFDASGKIVSIDGYWDQLTLLVQLGHVQVPSAARKPGQAPPAAPV